MGSRRVTLFWFNETGHTDHATIQLVKTPKRRKYWLHKGEIDDVSLLTSEIREDESVKSVDYTDQVFTIDLRERYDWKTASGYIEALFWQHVMPRGVKRYRVKNGWVRKHKGLIAIYLLMTVIVALIVAAALIH